jgi:hypothetical protein
MPRAGPGGMRSSTAVTDSVTEVPACSAWATGEAMGSVSSRISVYRSSSVRRSGSACQHPTSRARPSRSTTVTMQLSASVGTTSWASRPSADSPSRAPDSSAVTEESRAARSLARRAACSARTRSVTSRK